MIKKHKILLGTICCIAFSAINTIGTSNVKTVQASEVAIDEANFPDENFRNYISEHFDSDGNGRLSDTEINNIKKIDILRMKISDLKGIEHFKDLTTLSCTYNNITKLDISHNTKLTYLECNVNKIEELDISKNTALVDLHCSNNPISKLDLTHNTQLERLACGFSSLTELDVSKNSKLIMIDCQDCQITNLDLSNNSELYNLNCGNNPLKKIDVTKNPKLGMFSCAYFEHRVNVPLISQGEITELDLSKNPLLTHLSCSSTKVNTLKLNANTYNNLELNAKMLNYSNNNLVLQNLSNITLLSTSSNNKILKVTDITKPATYQFSSPTNDNGKTRDFTIIYVQDDNTNPAPVPSGNFTAPSCTRLFNDYNYTSPVSGSPIIIYGNGGTFKTGTTKTTNKQFTAYTDILASYKYTLNSKGIVKPAAGKVIVGITKSNTKPVVTKNKIIDRDAAKIARAKIKNGQITVTAAGKEKGLVYLWIIDTGDKGVSECCPVNVLLAPKKLEVQNTSGNKLSNTKIENGKTLDVCVTGFVSSTKTDDCTYTATVASNSKSYISVVPSGNSGNKFKITATGLKNNKNTKATIIFQCNENGKKFKFALTVLK